MGDIGLRPNTERQSDRQTRAATVTLQFLVPSQIMEEIVYKQVARYLEESSNLALRIHFHSTDMPSLFDRPHQTRSGFGQIFQYGHAGPSEGFRYGQS